MIYEPEAALADAMEDLAEKDLLIADLRARLAEVKILADSYCANCAPDSIQAQVAERFRAAARGEGDRG